MNLPLRAHCMLIYSFTPSKFFAEISLPCVLRNSGAMNLPLRAHCMLIYFFTPSKFFAEISHPCVLRNTVAMELTACCTLHAIFPQPSP
jgi:hypothetical protein